MKNITNYKSLRKYLETLFLKSNIDNFADIDWIFCEAVKKKRSALELIESFSESELEKIDKMVQQRLKHIPLDYIIGKSNFYGRDFEVNSNVLIPRLDTEVLIDTVLKKTKSESKLSFLDIGTGSGILAVTIEKETGYNAFAVDISSKALEVAKKNAENNQSNVKFILSDLFSNIGDLKVDFIVSNPPYIESDVVLTLDEEVKDNEPILALDGGKDGLDFYRKIICEVPKHLTEKGKIFFEIGFNQAENVKKLLEKDFCDICVVKDYDENDRVVFATKK